MRRARTGPAPAGTPAPGPAPAPVGDRQPAPEAPFRSRRRHVGYEGATNGEKEPRVHRPKPYPEAPTMLRVAELQLHEYVDREADRIVETLFEWLRIPSISAQPDHAA